MNPKDTADHRVIVVDITITKAAEAEHYMEYELKEETVESKGCTVTNATEAPCEPGFQVEPLEQCLNQHNTGKRRQSLLLEANGWKGMNTSLNL
jgi:hypothetical protein